MVALRQRIGRLAICYVIPYLLRILIYGSFRPNRNRWTLSQACSPPIQTSILHHGS